MDNCFVKVSKFLKILQICLKKFCECPHNIYVSTDNDNVYSKVIITAKSVFNYEKLNSGMSLDQLQSISFSPI